MKLNRRNLLKSALAIPCFGVLTPILRFVKQEEADTQLIKATIAQINGYGDKWRGMYLRGNVHTFNFGVVEYGKQIRPDNYSEFLHMFFVNLDKSTPCYPIGLKLDSRPTNDKAFRAAIEKHVVSNCRGQLLTDEQLYTSFPVARRVLNGTF